VKSAANARNYSNSIRSRDDTDEEILRKRKSTFNFLVLSSLLSISCLEILLEVCSLDWNGNRGSFDSLLGNEEAGSVEESLEVIAQIQGEGKVHRSSLKYCVGMQTS
jgi:hypothetical protein